MCTGNAGTTQPVRILVTNKDGKKVYADQASVALGGTIVAQAVDKGKPTTFDSETLVRLFSGSTVLETIRFHTSCSQPINLGDHFGSLEVVGIDTDKSEPIVMGAEIEYSYKITNNGGAPVSNVTVMDDKLGAIAGSPIASIGAGDLGTLIARAFVASATTNTVTVAGVTAGNVACSAMASATVASRPPPTQSLPCTGGAIALTLQYTGPAISGATTVQITGGSSSATYTLPSLSPGTILTSAAENGFTIDATAHGQTRLGARTEVRINGVLEILHTSCSCRDTPETNLMVCNPMCLDAGSPDNPTGSKGPPSPLWTLVSVRDPGNGVSTCETP
jgi:hypothetical protein